MPEHDESEETWFEGQVSSAAPSGTFDPKALRYTGSKLVGKGSMGKVLAVQDEHLGRQVAYKQLRTHMRGGVPVSDELIARFIREARITARLEHPNIVAVHDIGRSHDGGLYYTMRYVHGQTLESALDAATDLPARLALVPRLIDACQAMAYAHKRNVVHRDIKPANIVLGEFGETVVVDWGLAKDLSEVDDAPLTSHGAADSSFTHHATSTSHGSVLGTPAYMSPEQASGLTFQADERSDVWSLGAVLFEVLAGRRLVPDTDPKEAVERVRTGALPTLSEAAPRAPAELVAICERALAHDPRHRYRNAGQLARDLEAFQAGEFVRAYAYSSFERFQRAIQRNRVTVATGVIALLAIVAITAGSFQRVVEERDRARAADARTQQRLTTARALQSREALNKGHLQEADAFAVDALQHEELPRLRGVLASTGAAGLPVLSSTIHTPCRAMVASAIGVLCGDDDGLRVLGGELLSEVSVDALAARGGHRAVRTTKALQVVSDDNQTLFTIPLPEEALAVPPVFADRGLLVADRHTVTLYDDQGEPIWETLAGANLTQLAISETHVAALSQSRGLFLLDLATGERTHHAPAIGSKGNFALARVPGGYVVGGGDQRLLRLDDELEVTAEREVSTPVLRMAPSPDGALVAASTEGHEIVIVDPTTLEILHHMPVPEPHPAPASLGWDGRDLLVSSGDRVTRWSTADLKPRVVHMTEGIADIAFSADGSELLAADGSGRISLVDADSRTLKISFDAGRGVSTSVAFHDGELLAGNAQEGLQRFDRQGTQLEQVFRPPKIWVRAVESTSAGLVFVSQDPVLRVFREGAVEEVYTDPDGTRLWEVDQSPDGSHIVWTNADLRTVVAAMPGIDIVWEDDSRSTSRSVTLSPGGKLLARDTRDADVEVLDLETGQLVATFVQDAFAVDNLEFSADGRWLASASWDRKIRLYDMRSLKLAAVIEGHDHRVADVEFSPDGRTLASASWDDTVRFWDLSRVASTPTDLLEQAHTERGMKVDGVLLAWDTPAP